MLLWVESFQKWLLESEIKFVQVPVPGDNLAEPKNHFADGCIKVIQTTETTIILENALSFLMSM